VLVEDVERRAHLALDRLREPDPHAVREIGIIAVWGSGCRVWGLGLRVEG
jgi:hypothetical protein